MANMQVQATGDSQATPIHTNPGSLDVSRTVLASGARHECGRQGQTLAAFRFPRLPCGARVMGMVHEES